jgi:hypothetical protein
MVQLLASREVAFCGCPRDIAGYALGVTKLAEIQEAILQLDPIEQQVLRHWLDETAEETPEMIAAIDEGLRSLATEGGVPIEEARRHLRQWITG